jgi:formate dehydrogenase iron-sulfur subunit
MALTAFLTDATVCIGCKACEVACKEWNEVPEDGLGWSGFSYDNTKALGASTWRHVLFLEQHAVAGPQLADTTDPFRWIFLSDVCKHCANAGCLEACPTGSIVRTELGGVYVQPDVCNGCGYCVVSCPFGVIDKNLDDGHSATTGKRQGSCRRAPRRVRHNPFNLGTLKNLESVEKLA